MLKLIFIRKLTLHILGSCFWFRFHNFQKLKNKLKKTPFCTKKHEKGLNSFSSENWPTILWGPDCNSDFKIFKNSKINSKRPLCVPKSTKKAQIHFYHKTNPPYFGVLILISKFLKTIKWTKKDPLCTKKLTIHILGFHF